MDIRQKVLELTKKKIREELRKSNMLVDQFEKYKVTVRSFKEANKEVAQEQLANQITQDVADKPFKFTITTDPKETIDSIIMGQVSGIKPWSIERVMLTKKAVSRMIVPMWERTGNIDYVEANTRLRWRPYKPHSKLSFVDIVQETKHTLAGSTDLTHLQQVIDKLSAWGTLRITIK